jgi:uncharacterized damage-inducible protein DinB
MTVDDVRSLFAFNEWANDRTLTSIAQLSEEQFARHLGGSFPTIRDTAAHIVSAEWIWLRRWHGDSPAAVPDWLKAPTPAFLRQRLGEIEADRRAYLAGLSDRDLQTLLDYRRLNGEAFSKPLGHLLRHVVNHSTYHRGQIATMMRQVGGVPARTDLLDFDV